MAKQKPQSQVHRGLILASPAIRGADVKALQSELNDHSKSLDLEWLKLKADGKAGAKTFHAARLIGWVLGIDGQAMQLLERQRVSRYAQRLLRGKVKRTANQRLTAKARAKRVEKIRHKHNDGAAAALRISEAFVGQTERPAGTNRGPGVVSTCQRAIIGYDGVPWCGCFVGYVLRLAGVKGITSRIAYTPSIIEDGRAHRGGLAGIVAYANARPGDVVVFNFPGGDPVADHTGIVRAKLGNGQLATREGNTSSGSSGSQSNGGGVFDRTRTRSEVAAIIRPAYG